MTQVSHCLITRPEPAASALAKQVTAMGFAVCVSPLITYRDVSVSIDLDSYGGVILSSAAAVPALIRLANSAVHQVYAVGPKTAEAARGAGFQVIEGAGDAQALIQCVQAAAPQSPLIHLRGDHSIGDIASKLSAGGIETDECVVYQQLEGRLSPSAQALLCGDSPVILPLYSPRSAAILTQGVAPKAPVVPVFLSHAVQQSYDWPLPKSARVAAQPNGAAMLDTLRHVASQQRAG